MEYKLIKIVSSSQICQLRSVVLLTCIFAVLISVSQTSEAGWTASSNGVGWGSASASVTSVATGGVSAASMSGFGPASVGVPATVPATVVLPAWVPQPATVSAPLPGGAYAGSYAIGFWRSLWRSGGSGAGAAGPAGVDGWGPALEGSAEPTCGNIDVEGALNSLLTEFTLTGQLSFSANAGGHVSLLALDPHLIPANFSGTADTLVKMKIITTDKILFRLDAVGPITETINETFGLPTWLPQDEEYLIENLTVLTRGGAPPFPIPEPATLLLFGIGGMVLRRKFRA